MATLHPADRLMLRLIKIPHLADRIKGMLYQVNFDETITLLERVSRMKTLDRVVSADALPLVSLGNCAAPRCMS
jgi:hypothetical protein